MYFVWVTISIYVSSLVQHCSVADKFLFAAGGQLKFCYWGRYNCMLFFLCEPWICTIGQDIIINKLFWFHRIYSIFMLQLPLSCFLSCYNELYPQMGIAMPLQALRKKLFVGRRRSNVIMFFMLIGGFLPEAGITWVKSIRPGNTSG